MRPNAQRPTTPPIPAAMSREPPRIACWHWERLVAALPIRALVALVLQPQLAESRHDALNARLVSSGFFGQAREAQGNRKNFKTAC